MKEPRAAAEIGNAFATPDVQTFDLLSHELLVFLRLGHDVEAHLQMPLPKQVLLPIVSLVRQRVFRCSTPLGVAEVDGSRC